MRVKLYEKAEAGHTLVVTSDTDGGEENYEAVFTVNPMSGPSVEITHEWSKDTEGLLAGLDKLVAKAALAKDEIKARKPLLAKMVGLIRAEVSSL